MWQIFCKPSAHLAALAAFLSVALAAAHVPERAKRPTGESLEAARKEVKDLYQADYKKLRTANDKAELAQQMLKDAADTKSDANGRYALLTLAQDLASEAGDVALSLQVATAISTDFDVGVATTKANALVRLWGDKSRLSLEQKGAVARNASALVDPLLDEKELALAAKVVDVESEAARTAKEIALYRGAKDEAVDIQNLLAESKAISENNPQSESLVATAANHTMAGKFECFVQNDWDSGLAALTNGDDAELRDLANQTLAPDRDAAASIAVADKWWKISDGLSGRRQRCVRQFAANIYGQVLPELKGIDKKRADNRIATAAEYVRSAEPESTAIRENAKSVVNNQPRGKMRKSDSNPYTMFGAVKLSKDEIEATVNEWRAAKPKELERIKVELNNVEAGKAVEAKQLFDLVSQENVLIVPRKRCESYSSHKGMVFKATDGGYAAVLPYIAAETQQVIDKQSAYVSVDNHSPIILEGVDTRKLPPGKWQMQFLLKAAGSRIVPGVVGDKEVQVYQAVSSEGFPSDVTLW